MKITVFGVGHAGLVQAAVLAEVGHNVLCVDVDEYNIKNLMQGIVPFYESGLTALVQHNYSIGRLKFTTDVKLGVEHGIIQCITVGTPLDKYGVIDVKNVISVASSIAKYMNKYTMILNKSTVPIGTTEYIRNILYEILRSRNISYTFDLVFNPEFLKEGEAVVDCMDPDRILIGIDDNEKEVVNLLRDLYEPFNFKNDRMILMDIRSAELTKYTANGILAAKISFMNEISNIAEFFGADIEKVRQGIGADSRIGYSFIYPGCGYGGSCFSKDIQTLIYMANQAGYTPNLLKAVENVNDKQKNKLLELIYRHFGKNLLSKIFALWGLSFKPNTDDIREAPSCTLMESLWRAGAQVQAYDPKAMDNIRKCYGKCDHLCLMDSKEEVLYGADALIICTEWQNFLSPDFIVIKTLLKKPVIFDGRNLYDPQHLLNLGFVYYGIGYGASNSSHIV